MPEITTVSLGVAGLGGYARSIAELVHDTPLSGSHRLRIDAVCDPDLDLHAERVNELKQAGVAVYDDYEQMLKHPGLDAVWLPVPIDLHVPFTRQALAAGKAVMLEKPVCGTIQELDELIAARDEAGLPVLVGFQDIYDASTWQLKRRLLAGDLGEMSRVSVVSCWPRTEAYFNRAAWAGKVRHRETWVLDSPVNNAMAHFVNVVLFLLGDTPESSATPTAIEAELYRAADIENYDTASLRLTFADRPPFLVLMTHASDQQVGPIVEMHGKRGLIRREQNGLTFDLDGQSQQQPLDVYVRRDMLSAFAGTVSGSAPDQLALATLEVARAHTLTINAASQAAAVYDVPEADINEVDWQGSTVRTIRGIVEAFHHCAEQGLMLHESGRYAFTRPAGQMDLTDYRAFAGLAPVETA
jgi:predicted dehydrogenase